MSITKKYLKSKACCKVTFKLPKGVAIDAKQVALVGGFNDWSTGANLMEKSKDGSYKITLDLEAGKQYEFKYLINGESWTNDNEADAYTNNDFGGENGIVLL